MKIDNLKVYDLEESLIASGYPMRTKLDSHEPDYKDIKRGLKLTEASNGNGAHGQWLTGVRVNFDLTCTNKMWIEASRYRFFEFVSSQSTMHRISKFNFSETYNEYVDPRIIDIMQEKVDDYNKLCQTMSQKIDNVDPEWESRYREEQEEIRKIKYLELLYSNPAGFEITARISTNYRCLLNIYIQRHDHRLPEWREFCKCMYDNLPMFKEVVEAYYHNYNYDDVVNCSTHIDKDNPIEGQLSMECIHG